MKKQLFTFIAAVATNFAFAQSIPNGSFESWTTTSFEDPTFFQCANDETHNGGYSPANVKKSTDAYHGNYAIQMTTVTNGVDTAGGYFAYGNPGGNGTPQGGLPINQKPTGIRFYYKNSMVVGDTGLVLCVFKKAGTVIGQYIYTTTGVHSSYTLFFQTFSPALSQIPDTVVFAATCANFMNNAKKFIPGSTITIDSISFTGISAQPANMNGDFESWHTVSRDNLNGWNGHGAIKTTNKYNGTYAVELITNPPGFGNNQVDVGNISNTKNQNCNNCQPKGGSPFSNQIDTLVFYYKYLPANFPSYTDSAEVNISFSKNGVWFDGRGVQLTPSISGFTKIEIPFTLSQVPDTMQLNINSSRYPALISYIGSDLIIDQLYFKSQKIPVSIFSLPASGCQGVPIQLYDKSANMPIAWQWITTGSTPTNSSTQQNPVVTYTNTGTFNVSLQAKDSFGSGAYLTQTIIIYPNPSVSASSSIICGGNPAVLTASGASTYTWSNASIGATVTVTPSSSTMYTVTGTNSQGCSNSATTLVTVPVPDSPDICMVSCDSASLNNVIYWDKTMYPNVDSFVVYREVYTGNYSRIGAQHQSVLSQFTDTARSVTPANGDPNIGSYRYKLQIRDTCGNYGVLGKYHNTVYITTNNSGSYNWNSYLVEGSIQTPVSTFDLLRDDNNNGTWHSIGFVSGNQSSLNDPSYLSYPNANWRVDAHGFNCTPTARYGNNSTQGAVVKSKSNITNNRMIGIKSLTQTFAVYPNPSTGIITLQSEKELGLVTVYNSLGQTVYQEKISETTKTIDLKNQTSGIYIIFLQGKHIKLVKE